MHEGREIYTRKLSKSYDKDFVEASLQILARVALQGVVQFRLICQFSKLSIKNALVPFRS